MQQLTGRQVGWGRQRSGRGTEGENSSQRIIHQRVLFMVTNAVLWKRDEWFDENDDRLRSCCQVIYLSKFHIKLKHWNIRDLIFFIRVVVITNLDMFVWSVTNSMIQYWQTSTFLWHFQTIHHSYGCDEFIYLCHGRQVLDMDFLCLGQKIIWIHSAEY